MKIASWNVNQLNAEKVVRIYETLENEKIDVMFILETKRKKEMIEELFQKSKEKGFSLLSSVHVPAHYHGLCVLYKSSIKELKQIDLKDTLLQKIPNRKDNKNKEQNAYDGRVIAFEYKQMAIVCSYTPNAGRNLCYLQYRQIWDQHFQEFLVELDKKNKNGVVWIGDINVAPTEIDVTKPKLMKSYPGFSQQEKTSLQNFEKDQKWCDLWRHEHPKIMDYTWVRPSTNSAMRLDSIWISPTVQIKKLAHNSFILPFQADLSNIDHKAIGCNISTIN